MGKLNATQAIRKFWQLVHNSAKFTIREFLEVWKSKKSLSYAVGHMLSKMATENFFGTVRGAMTTVSEALKGTAVPHIDNMVGSLQKIAKYIRTTVDDAFDLTDKAIKDDPAGATKKILLALGVPVAYLTITMEGKNIHIEDNVNSYGQAKRLLEDSSLWNKTFQELHLSNDPAVLSSEVNLGLDIKGDDMNAKVAGSGGGYHPHPGENDVGPFGLPINEDIVEKGNPLVANNLAKQFGASALDSFLTRLDPQKQKFLESLGINGETLMSLLPLLVSKKPHVDTPKEVVEEIIDVNETLPELTKDDDEIRSMQALSDKFVTRTDLDWERTVTSMAIVDAAASALTHGVHDLIMIRQALALEPDAFAAAVKNRYGFMPAEYVTRVLMEETPRYRITK